MQTVLTKINKEKSSTWHSFIADTDSSNSEVRITYMIIVMIWGLHFNRDVN